MSNALSLRRVPLMTIRAHPVRSIIIAVLAIAQAACVFGGLILVSLPSLSAGSAPTSSSIRRPA